MSSVYYLARTPAIAIADNIRIMSIIAQCEATPLIVVVDNIHNMRRMTGCVAFQKYSPRRFILQAENGASGNRTAQCL